MNSKSIGKLLVFEGPKNTGKTTLSKFAVDHLNSIGVKSRLFAFPGNEEGTIGAEIYKIHHNASSLSIRMPSATSLQALHVAAHIDAIETTILPALASGTTVVLDRFWWSTLVYGEIFGVKPSLLCLLIEAEKLCWGDFCPLAVFYTDQLVPFTGERTDEWLKTKEGYENLLLQTGSKENVIRLSARDSIEEAKKEFLGKLPSLK